jgi:hypothetical protein
VYYISVSVYQQISLTLHDDKISVYIYISVSVYQQMSHTLYDDIISVYISVSVYQQMSLTLHDDIINVYICIVCQQMFLKLKIYIYTLIVSSCSVIDICWYTARDIYIH